MSRLRIDDPPRGVDVELTDEQLAITLRGLTANRRTPSALPLIEPTSVAMTLWAVLSKAGFVAIIAGLLASTIGAVMLAFHGRRREQIRIDREVLVHEHRGLLRRRRTHAIGALASVVALRASWTGADLLTSAIFGPGRCYLAVSVDTSDETLAWLDRTLAQALAWFQRPHPELRRFSDPGRLAA